MSSGKLGSFRSLELNWEKARYQEIEMPELQERNKGVYDDIADCLPVDPFGMDMKSTVAAIKGWLQDFDEDFESGFSKFGIEEDEKSTAEDGLLVGVDLFFNGHMKLPSLKGNLNIGAISILDQSFDGFGNDYGLTNGGSDRKSKLGNVDVCDKGKEPQSIGGEAHDALVFALGYLGVRDLLSVERVCKALRDAVRGDSLLWRSISIGHPLNKKLTDEGVVNLTRRAQGNLQCLNLVQCIRITDNGLRQVLESNPRLTKLSVPGCVKLTVNGILSSLRALMSAGTLRIKYLRIGGLCGVTEDQYEELKSLLGVDNSMLPRTKKPLFHRAGQLYLSSDDDQAIDIETCPRCQKVKLVYDCPAESCQEKGKANPVCRACTSCIARCVHCGRCIEDRDYEETFYLDFLCLDCCPTEARTKGCFLVWGYSFSSGDEVPDLPLP